MPLSPKTLGTSGMCRSSLDGNRDPTSNCVGKDALVHIGECTDLEVSLCRSNGEVGDKAELSAAELMVRGRAKGHLGQGDLQPVLAKPSNSPPFYS